MDFANLSELAVLADCTPQARPIALAFFSPEAFRTFLQSTPAEEDEEEVLTAVKTEESAEGVN
jgi:hypothetical protein